MLHPDSIAGRLRRILARFIGVDRDELDARSRRTEQLRRETIRARLVAEAVTKRGRLDREVNHAEAIVQGRK